MTLSFGIMFLFCGVKKNVQAWNAQLISLCPFCVASTDGPSVHKKYEFDNYIFAITTEVSGKITANLEHEDDLVHAQGFTSLVHQGKVLSDKKTIEENNIGAEAPIEMSLRLLVGTEENVSMGSLESFESEDDRTLADDKKRKLEGKSTRPSEDAMYLRREIIDAIKRTNEKIETLAKSIRKDGKYDENGELLEESPIQTNR